MRRQMGWIYLASGLIYSAQMTFATLYALGHVHGVIIGKGVWSQLYFGHFLFTVLAGMGCLGFHFLKTGTFAVQTLVDFLIGLACFIVLFGLTGAALIGRLVAPWFSLTPAAFLLYYSYRLLSGRALLPRFEITNILS